MSRLDEIDIKFLTGVGPKRAELLAEQLHIRTFYDLLYYFPFRYVDRSRIFQIRELESGMPFIQLKGRFVTMTTEGIVFRRHRHHRRGVVQPHKIRS